MGLLDKAKGSQLVANPDLDVLIKKLDPLESGVDFSIQLFRNLSEYFDVEKASLFLLSESSKSFDCLLAKGYDKTTSNRLRLDESFLDSDVFCFLKSKQKSYYTSEVPVFLKDFMSSREYGLLEGMYWLPFLVDGNLFSIIMISQWNSTIPDSWNELFDSISSRYSATIFNSRKSLLKMNAPSSRTNKSDLPDFIDKYRGKNFIILKINLNPLIALLYRSDGLSLVNIKKEIMTVFKTMVGSYQEVFELSNQQLLLMLDKDRTADKELFIHQISASLPLLFQDLEKAPPIEYVYFNNPVDETTRDALISELI